MGKHVDRYKEGHKVVIEDQTELVASLNAQIAELGGKIEDLVKKLAEKQEKGNKKAEKQEKVEVKTEVKEDNKTE